MTCYCNCSSKIHHFFKWILLAVDRQGHRSVTSMPLKHGFTKTALLYFILKHERVSFSVRSGSLFKVSFHCSTKACFFLTKNSSMICIRSVLDWHLRDGVKPTHSDHSQFCQHVVFAQRVKLDLPSVLQTLSTRQASSLSVKAHQQTPELSGSQPFNKVMDHCCEFQTPVGGKWEMSLMSRHTNTVATSSLICVFIKTT